MSRDDIHKLLGGYATGTLTPEEQQTLFAAALDDQELFDALAREQALRDLLQDPGAKAQLLAALDQKHVRWYERLFVHWRPLAAAAAMAGVGAIAVVVWQNGRPEKPALMAKATLPPPPSAPESQAEPAPSPAVGPSLTENGRTAPKSEAKPAAPVVAPREERAAPPKPVEAPVVRRQLEKEIAQQEAEQKGKQKDLARADSDARLPLAPGVPSNGVATGFRQSAGAGGTRGSLDGAAPPAIASEAPKPQPQPAQQLAQIQAPQAPSAQTANGQQGQQQALQGRSTQQMIQVAPQLSPPPPTKAEVPVQANAAVVDTVASPDAKTLYYARTASAPAGVAGASGFGVARTTQARAKKEAPPATGSGGRGDSNAPASAELGVQARAVNPGVKYDFQRETAGGNWQAVDPLALKSGDVVRLQVTANDRGLLQVHARGTGGEWREILSRSVPAGQSYPTAPLAPGEKEVRVTLTRLPLVGGLLRDDKGQVRKQTEQEATYVVGGPGANQVQFVITLNFH